MESDDLMEIGPKTGNDEEEHSISEKNIETVNDDANEAEASEASEEAKIYDAGNGTHTSQSGGGVFNYLVSSSFPQAFFSNVAILLISILIINIPSLLSICLIIY
jgi:hypothetical protein